MRRPQILRRRSTADWAIRLALTMAALGLAYASVTHALGTALRSRSTEVAYRLAGDDGRIAALMSSVLSGPEATSTERTRADDIARGALREDATAVAAIATLGINAAVRGDVRAARRLFAYSETLSRRDLRTRLWAIEDAVAREDVPAAIRSYDIALRTSRPAIDLLFPILSSAIDAPDIRTELTKVMTRGPSWDGLFIGYVGANGPNPSATAALFGELARAGVTIPQASRSATVNRLVLAGRNQDAWSYYASTTVGADRRRSRDPHFVAFLEHPSLFDWTTVSEAGLSSTIQRGDRGGVVDFVAPASIGGVLLRQTQLLPTGSYALVGRSSGIEQSPSARSYWALTCSDGRELGRAELMHSGDAGKRFSGRFKVPDDCPLQTLALVALPSNEVGGVSGRIEYVQLAPISGT